jgi:hypothetical protein
MSRICSTMSWSPRPLSSSLGGRFLGGSGAAGLLLHHPLIVPNRCVMRHLRVRVGDGLGDLAPIGCKAESCGFGRCSMFCCRPLCPSRRLLGDAERKEITAPRHLIVSFREEMRIDLYYCPIRLLTQLSYYNVSSQDSLDISSASDTGSIPEAVTTTTETDTMTNKLNIVDAILLPQA